MIAHCHWAILPLYKLKQSFFDPNFFLVVWVGITNSQIALSLKPENLRWKILTSPWFEPLSNMFLPTPGNTLSCDYSVNPKQHLNTLEILPGCHVDPKTVLSLFQALVIVFLFFPQKWSLISSLLPIQLKVKGQRIPIPSCSLLLKWNIVVTWTPLLLA